MSNERPTQAGAMIVSCTNAEAASCTVRDTIFMLQGVLRVERLSGVKLLVVLARDGWTSENSDADRIAKAVKSINNVSAVEWVPVGHGDPLCSDIRSTADRLIRDVAKTIERPERIPGEPDGDFVTELRVRHAIAYDINKAASRLAWDEKP